jgi:hypothetical protein
MQKRTLKERLKDPKILGAIRHLLTALGPVVTVLMLSDDPATLISNLLYPENFLAAVGLLIAGAGFYLSWTAKEKKQ